MTKLDEIVEVLRRAGFSRDGETAVERVRIPTMKSPVFGGSGGEARDIGGRARYTRSGTDLRVTAGPRTVNVYRVIDGKTEFLANYKTREVDLDALLKLVATRTCTRCENVELHTSGYDVCDACTVILLKPRPK